MNESSRGPEARDPALDPSGYTLINPPAAGPRQIFRPRRIILIVERALQLTRAGADPVEATLEAVRSRIRPIFMTTFTTVLGLLPLVIFPGAGSELYRGLGAVILGGILFSTVITLVQVPLLLVLAFRVFGTERDRDQPPEVAAGAAAVVGT